MSSALTTKVVAGQRCRHGAPSPRPCGDPTPDAPAHAATIRPPGLSRKMRLTRAIACMRPAPCIGLWPHQISRNVRSVRPTDDMMIESTAPSRWTRRCSLIDRMSSHLAHDVVSRPFRRDASTSIRVGRTRSRSDRHAHSWNPAADPGRRSRSNWLPCPRWTVMPSTVWTADSTRAAIDDPAG